MKSVKISEDVYRAAKRLSKELEREKANEGMRHIGISDAIGFAIMKTTDSIERKKRLLSAAGGWKDLDTDKMIKEIYESRSIGRTDISFDK